MQTLGTLSIQGSKTSFDVKSKILVLKRNPDLQCKQDYQNVGRKNDRPEDKRTWEDSGSF